MRRPEQIISILMTGIGTLLLSGCSESPFLGAAGIRQGMPSQQIQSAAGHPDSVGHVVHIAVPFFPDDTDQCGPATLASLLTFWGLPMDLEALKEDTYMRRLRGTLPIDLLLAAQARGLQAHGSSGTLETLQAELDAGHPIVALLNLGWTVFPQGHYVVVTGYDERRQGVYLHSGLARDVFVPYARYLTAWEKTGRWMLRVQPMKRHVNEYGVTDGRG